MMMAGGHDHDAALSRLEDVLAGLPFDRALPGLHELLRRAGIDEDYLFEDDRARKVLHEAIVARPLGTSLRVERWSTEVEVLTLEVDVLAQRLADPLTSLEDRAAATARLSTVRRRLEEIKRLL